VLDHPFSIIELLRDLVIPLIGWAALELRGLRLKIVGLEEWVRNHDIRDDDRFETHNERMNRQEARLESFHDRRTR
jgi:hypothetical protein